jgi:hypothetical protein
MLIIDDSEIYSSSNKKGVILMSPEPAEKRKNIKEIPTDKLVGPVERPVIGIKLNDGGHTPLQPVQKMTIDSNNEAYQSVESL